MEDKDFSQNNSGSQWIAEGQAGKISDSGDTIGDSRLSVRSMLGLSDVVTLIEMRYYLSLATQKEG